MTYYEVIVAQSSKMQIRLQMVQAALATNVSQAARTFGTTRSTVRKWLRRYGQEGYRGLADHSRAPHYIPHKTSAATEKRLLGLRERYPDWGPERLEVHFRLGCSCTAAKRIFRTAGLTKRRKKKRVRNDLRAQKAALRPFEKIQVDTKDLCDIPSYARYMRQLGLARYEYTARDLKTGATWIALSDTNDTVQAAKFIGYLLAYLAACGVDLSRTTLQTDNGSEYIGNVNKRNPGTSPFELIVKQFTGRLPIRIFPGAKTSQSDVESYHNLIEEEFWAVEDLSSEGKLLGRSRTYQIYFNHHRKNLWRGGRTPKEILNEAAPHIRNTVLTLAPIRLESIHLPPVKSGYHLPDLVSLTSKVQDVTVPVCLGVRPGMGT